MPPPNGANWGACTIQGDLLWFKNLPAKGKDIWINEGGCIKAGKVDLDLIFRLGWKNTLAPIGQLKDLIQKDDSKPDWGDAPEWANYLARDEDGGWYWYENNPVAGCDEWDENGGKLSKAGFSLEDINWQDTLEKRPN